MRQRFAKDFGGTLRFRPPEGVPTSATVTILRARDGSAMPVPVQGATATIAAVTGELSFILVAANTPDPRTNGNLYRAVWTYVVGGVTYQADELFEVNARLLRPMLTTDEVGRYLPADWDQLLEGGVTAAKQTIEDAWDDLLDDLVAHDIRPDRIMDADRLRRPHRAKALANLKRSFGPEWTEAADKADAAYQSALDALLAEPGWVDLDDDGKGDDETETTMGQVRLTR